MANVVVTDGEERAALAVVRSLGRAGHRVISTSTSGHSVSGGSRFSHEEAQLPDPLADPEAFRSELKLIVAKRDVEILIPVSEASLRAVLPFRETFLPATIPFPDALQFQSISDKQILLEKARALGIPEPTVGVIADPEDWGKVAALDQLPYPLVLKPARSVNVGSTGLRKNTVRYAVDADDLRRILQKLPDAAYPILLQRRIEGAGIGVFLLVHGGEALAAFGHRRLREKPPSGGVSTLRESVDIPPGLLAQSLSLLREFQWDGVAMVEYKVDRHSGIPCLMEVNGRFWGSLQLAVDAGVDFPKLLMDKAMGRVTSDSASYRRGVLSRWEWGEFDHFLARMRKSRETLGLPADAPGRGTALWHFLRGFLPPVRSEVFRFDDPRPFLRESLSWIRSGTGQSRGGP